MKSIIITTRALLVVLFSVSVAFPSGETNVPWEVNELSVTAGSSGYQYSFLVDEGNNLKSITVKWGEKNIVLDKTKLPLVNKPILRKISFLSEDGEPLSPKDNLILVIPYNNIHFGISHKPSGVIDVVRLYFKKGSLEYWEISEAIEGSPGKWKFHSYDVRSKKKINEGEEESMLNPYARFDYNSDDWLR